MIRINLLPKKVSKKKLGLVQHLIATLLIFTLTFVVIGYFWVSLNGKIADLKKQVAAAAAEKEKLKDVNSQKQKYEQNIEKLKSKLDIISKIKEKRFLPVRLFDELTKVLGSDTPVWLTRLSISDENIQIEGFSLSNPDLADFVTSLDETPFYRNVDLLFSEKVTKDDREIYRFSLNAKAQTVNDKPKTTAGN